MKRIGLLFCVFVCIAGFVAAQTEADFDTKAEGNGVVVTKYKGKGGDVVIPATIGGKAVVGIDRVAFQNSKSLTSVTIPAGVITIGNYAFRGCSALSSVTIPAGVTSIGISAFNGCSGLTSVTIPASVTAIGRYAFGFCSSLASVAIPAGVTIIGEAAFGGCSSLASITIPATNQQYKEIEGALFTKDGRTLLAYPSGNGKTGYAIPAGVVRIGANVFSDCNLTSVTIPASVTIIGENAFSNCESLKSITIPAGVTTISEAAFYGSGLESITLPASVTSVGYAAFRHLRRETHPDIVKRFGEDPFSGYQ
jgi:hypothetical protein